MGRGVKFDAFEASDVRQLADELGARVMTLDELHKPTMHRDRPAEREASGRRSTTLRTAFGIIERHRVKVWVRNAYKELARVNA